MGENSIGSLSRMSLQRPLLDASRTRNDLENGVDWVFYPKKAVLSKIGNEASLPKPQACGTTVTMARACNPGI